MAKVRLDSLRSPLSGFTLVEMAVVLMIISVVVAGGTVMGVKYFTETQDKITKSRMDAIDAALLNFRKVNNRLPCPADGSTVLTSANFGREAATPGTCTGGTPAANFTSGNVVQGVVPIKALNLADDYMYDGWGRRISYAVDIRHTATNAFWTYAVTDTCTNAIRIEDGAGNVRSSGGIYLLLSHGPSGHGGYNRAGSGTRYNSQMNGANKLENCDCTDTNTATPSTTAFDAVYIQRNPTADPANALNNFDDIVRFKERWQLEPAGIAAPKNYPTSWPTLAVGMQATPYIRFFGHNPVNEAYSALPDPVDMPQNAVSDISFSKENLYIAYSMWFTSPYMGIYKRSCGGQLSRLTPPTTLPSSSSFKALFSHDSNYLAIAADNSTVNNLLVYKRNGDTFTAYPIAGGPPAPGNNVSSLAFSSDDKYIMTSNWNVTNTIVTYTNDGTQFTRGATAAFGVGIGTDISPDEKYLAIGLANGGTTGTNLKFYTYNAGSVTPIAGQPTAIPTITGTSRPRISFAPNGVYMSFTHDAAPFFYVYQISPSSPTFTKIADPAVLPATASAAAYLGTSWSHDSAYVAFTSDTTPFIYVYKRTTNTITKHPTPGALPAVAVSVAFRKKMSYE